SGRRQLDAIIQLTPARQAGLHARNGGDAYREATWELRDPWVTRNKNVFRGAEVFEFRIKGALEALPNFSDSPNQATPVQHLRDRAGSVAVFQEISVAGFHGT
ncbi:hypothetical protein, partial [Candidatus Pollutiaquabacter sp.]|uniref:hypothetical protein n=1 Tax=Candidatus Pollutiaquabacter sp. TaxID=3416354 RepID=UPI003D0B604E